MDLLRESYLMLNRLKGNEGISSMLAAGLMALLLSGCALDADRDDTTADGFLLEAAEAQQTEERRYHPLQLTESLRIGGEGSELMLYDPIDIEVDRAGNIYVLDAGTQQVHRFDPEGALVATYGRGQGEGPGEFTRLADFHVQANGEVVMLDLEARKVARFGADESLLGEHRVTGTPIQIAASDEEHVVLSLAEDDLFTTFDAQGQAQRQFGSLLADQAQRSLALQGTLTMAQDTLYYLSSYSGRMATFLSDGTSLYATQSVEPEALPTLTPVAERTRRLDREAGAPIYGPLLSAHDGLLYTNVFYPEENRLVIDVYDAKNGTYQFSANYEEPCGPYEMTDQHIYAVCDAQVVRFAYVLE